MRTLGSICATAFAVALFATCIGVVAIRSLGMGTAVVAGGSMEPTISDGSLVIIESVAPSVIARGDIGISVECRPQRHQIAIGDSHHRVAHGFRNAA